MKRPSLQLPPSFPPTPHPDSSWGRGALKKKIPPSPVIMIVFWQLLL